MITPKGLLRLDAKNLQITVADLGRSIPSTPSYIMIDSKRRLWITYFRFGYFVYDTKTNKSEYVDKVFWPMAVNEDSESNIWVSSWEEGLYAGR